MCLQMVSLCEGWRFDYLNNASAQERKEAFKVFHDISEEQELLQQHREFIPQVVFNIVYHQHLRVLCKCMKRKRPFGKDN